MTRWKLVVGPLVLSDLTDINEHYSNVAPEQVPRWRGEFADTIRSIRDNPYLGREDRPGIRRRATRVFPYHVWYFVDECNHVVAIAAVLHQRRDPALTILRTL